MINNYKEGAECTCTVFDKTMNLSFGKYEVKTLLYKNGELKEHDSMLPNLHGAPQDDTSLTKKFET